MIQVPKNNNFRKTRSSLGQENPIKEVEPVAPKPRKLRITNKNILYWGPNTSTKLNLKRELIFFWISSSLDVPAEVTQEEGHTRFLIHLPSAVRALIFLARRTQSFLSFGDREVEFLCANDLIVLHSLGFFFVFIIYIF